MKKIPTRTRPTTAASLPKCRNPFMREFYAEMRQTPAKDRNLDVLRLAEHFNESNANDRRTLFNRACEWCGIPDDVQRYIDRYLLAAIDLQTEQIVIPPLATTDKERKLLTHARALDALSPATLHALIDLAEASADSIRRNIEARTRGGAQ